jgi:hypothetical protein
MSKKKSAALSCWVPLSIKLRLEHAARLDERSTSQYLVRILERSLPSPIYSWRSEMRSIVHLPTSTCVDSERGERVEMLSFEAERKPTPPRRRI